MSNVLFHTCKEDPNAMLISIGADVADKADVENLQLALNGPNGNGVIFKVRAWSQRGEPAEQSLIFEDRDGKWREGPITSTDHVRSGIYLGHGFAVATKD